MRLAVPLFSDYYSKILNTHIMYGIVESALRAGITDIHVVPMGDGYEINSEQLDCHLGEQKELEGRDCRSLLEGLRDALNDMIMTHYAVGLPIK